MKSLITALKPVVRLILLILLCCGFNNDVNAQHHTLKAKHKIAKNKILYGNASYYAGKFHGRRTASGETLNQNKYTCACNILPLGTWLKITNIRNKKSVVVKVNDRMHKKMKRIADVTTIAAKKLGIMGMGIAKVKVEVFGKKRPRQHV